MDLPKAYDPQVAESKWQQFWQEKAIYEYKENKNKETYAIDTPPPTVSGDMHMGHAFSYTQQDIIARFQRMQGKNVFFPFGTDDNGLPTERLVEKKRKLRSTTMSRKDFVTQCNEFITEEQPRFISGWQQIGMSCDFTNAYSTITPQAQITAQASFIDLYNKGHIYEQESPISWCVKCQTAIAQAEFESVEKKSHFNDIAFLCEGKELMISTTRPELLPACVALCYHPSDKRYTKLTEKFAKVPLFDYEVPLLADESVNQEKGTGLMMICTFGDKEDVEKWHKHKLPLRVVFENYGKMNKLAGSFAGLNIETARKEILAKLQESGQLKKQQPITHTTNVHERCKTPIEFLKTKQWYIKILDNKKELLQTADKITWYPPHMKVRYQHWVQNLNWDWCISRQRHFGIPIPVWKDQAGNIILPEPKELPVDPTRQQPKKAEGKQLTGETDVLDTWATSSLTPEIATNWKAQGLYPYTWQDKPFALRPQAHDIIRTWLFYTIVKSYYHFGRIPWQNIMISGHAQDPKGKKMSKSLGNIIAPQDMIQKYSADALRFWAAGSKLGDDLPFQEKDLLTGKRMTTKLWNAFRFMRPHLQDFKEGNSTETGDLWILDHLTETIETATTSFQKYEYAQAKAAIDQFFWLFCDYYLEIVKDRLYNPDTRGTKARESAQATVHTTFLTILQLLAPIMPHITEELYQAHYKQHQKVASIHITTWPTAKLRNPTQRKLGDQAKEIIATVRKWKSEQQVSLKNPITTLTIADGKQLAPLFDDLKAVLHAQKIKFSGTTTLKTESGLKIGVQ